MIKQRLNGGWTVLAVAGEEIPPAIAGRVIPARVPGCVHTDLLRAGLIDDPYFGQNEPRQRWIGLTDWQYRTAFDADPRFFDEERIDLVCDGLDTVATIVLNSREVARTFNMHRGYRFDVRGIVRPGHNELAITFESPVQYAERIRKQLGNWPAITYGGQFNFIRKMACNFGWDWGPIVPTCGIWRDIRIEAWSGVRIAGVRASRIEVKSGHAASDYVVSLERSSPQAVSVYAQLRGHGEQAVFETSAQSNEAPIRFEIPNAQLWWPAGHGGQPLYDLQIEANYAGRPADPLRKRTGLRTVQLDTSPDDIGRKFVVNINGKPIFCKGFNWIPDDCFLDRACDPARVRKRTQQALDANANMLRVWGGGIYETDDFYDICDELGMLVWQDFLFACAMYPELDPVKSEVAAEARYNVERLSTHPSLVLWNGCNENIWGYHAWWGKDEEGTSRPWKDLVTGKGWGAGYYLELLPKILKDLDPTRPYWAASPWSGDPDIDDGLHPNLATHGNKHIWEVWHGADGDYSNYRKYAPRFCSEFGYQGPPAYATLAKYLDKSGLKRGSASIQMHQKSPGGNERNDKLLARDFDIENLSFDEWHYLLQVNQSRALTAGVEWFRSRQPTCMGTLYWQLNDCYPVISWSAIDCDGRPKPLWYATRRFYAPRLLTIQPEADGRLWLHAINDDDVPWSPAAVRVTRRRFDGRALVEQSVDVSVPPRQTKRYLLSLEMSTPGDPGAELIRAGGASGPTWFFQADHHLSYPDPAFDWTMTRDGDKHCLAITARALLRELCLQADRLDPDATVNEQLVTLLPGESFTFVVNSAAPITGAQLTTPPVLQCVNRFGRK